MFQKDKSYFNDKLKYIYCSYEVLCMCYSFGCVLSTTWSKKEASFYHYLEWWQLERMPKRPMDD